MKQEILNLLASFLLREITSKDRLHVTSNVLQASKIIMEGKK